MSADDIRILAVHAHPDDEAIWTGLTLAKAARLGYNVHTVTCTLGEEGEVIGEELARLVTPEQRSDGTGLLGGYRIAELQRALTSLGINNQDGVVGTEGSPLFLGGAGAWRDSGMEGSPSIEHARAFANVDNFHDEVAQLVDLIEDMRPDIVITYAADGGYGHPDHKRAHRITHAAVEKVADEATPKQVLWCVTDRAAVEAGLATVGEEIPEGWKRGDIAAVNARMVDFTVMGNENDIATKATAMAAHATQVIVDGPVFALSNLVVQPLLDSEAYVVAFTAPGVDDDYSRVLLQGVVGSATKQSESGWTYGGAGSPEEWIEK